MGALSSPLFCKWTRQVSFAVGHRTDVCTSHSHRNIADSTLFTSPTTQNHEEFIATKTRTHGIASNQFWLFTATLLVPNAASPFPTNQKAALVTYTHSSQFHQTLFNIIVVVAFVPPHSKAFTEVKTEALNAFHWFVSQRFFLFGSNITARFTTRNCKCRLRQVHYQLPDSRSGSLSIIHRRLSSSP